MRSIIVIIVVLISLPGLSQESGKDILPKNAFDAGIIAITLNGNGGFYFEYQHYVNEKLSWLIRPGVTGLSLPGDSVCYFLMAGIKLQVSELY